MTLSDEGGQRERARTRRSVLKQSLRLDPLEARRREFLSRDRYFLANARRSSTAWNSGAWSRRYWSGLRDRPLVLASLCADALTVPGIITSAATWLYRRC
jgi:hypothetical protein